MNLATIIVLLQAVLGLLSTPNLSPAAQLQANQLAGQVISMATQALAQPPDTQLGSAPSSTFTITAPTSTDNSQPIVINVTPAATEPLPVIAQPPQSVATATVVTAPSFFGSGSSLEETAVTSSSISVYFHPGKLVGDTFSLTAKCDTVNMGLGADCTSYIPQAVDITQNTDSNHPVTISGLVPCAKYRFVVVAANAMGTDTTNGSQAFDTVPDNATPAQIRSCTVAW